MKHTPHLFIPAPWDAKTLPVSRSQSNHLSKVLRLNEGDPLTYTDGEGTHGQGVWTGSGDVERGQEREVERPSRLVMAVAPPSSKERARFVVEKLAELGVERLRWLDSEWGSGRVPSQSKITAWAVSGLEQSRGAWLLDVSASMSTWSDFDGPVAACVPDGPDQQLDEIRTLAIGPEGGFAPAEVPTGVRTVGLGATILRVETAAIVAAALFR